MSGSSSYCSDSDDEDYDDGAGPGRFQTGTGASALAEVHDYAQAYAPLDTDVLGDDSSDPDDDDFFLDAAISGKKGARGGACSPPATACFPPATAPIGVRRCREPAAPPRSRAHNACVRLQIATARPGRRPICSSISGTAQTSGPRCAGLPGMRAGRPQHARGAIGAQTHAETPHARQGVELVDHRRAADLLEKAKKDAEAELRLQQEREALKDKGQDKDKQAAAENQKKKHAMRRGSGLPPGDFMLEGFVPAAGGSGWGVDSWLESQQQGGQQEEAEEPAAKDARAPEDATFETLNDGSTALLVTPGKRLKLNLAPLLEGGDANKEKREKEDRRRKKRRSKFLGAWGGFGGFGSGADSKNLRGFGGGTNSPPAEGGNLSGPLWQGSWKEWVNEYTVTMDVKIHEPPREGLSLFQTALVHAEEHKGQVSRHSPEHVRAPSVRERACPRVQWSKGVPCMRQGNGRGRLKQSDGEALISPAGGVGVLGYFGDAKARVRADRWVRVAVSVKCSADSKQKGEMLTYVDAVPGR